MRIYLPTCGCRQARDHTAPAVQKARHECRTPSSDSPRAVAPGAAATQPPHACGRCMPFAHPLADDTGPALRVRLGVGRQLLLELGQVLDHLSEGGGGTPAPARAMCVSTPHTCRQASPHADRMQQLAEACTARMRAHTYAHAGTQAVCIYHCPLPPHQRATSTLLQAAPSSSPVRAPACLAKAGCSTAANEHPYAKATPPGPRPPPQKNTTRTHTRSTQPPHLRHGGPLHRVGSPAAADERPQPVIHARGPRRPVAARNQLRIVLQWGGQMHTHRARGQMHTHRARGQTWGVRACEAQYAAHTDMHAHSHNADVRACQCVQSTTGAACERPATP